MIPETNGSSVHLSVSPQFDPLPIESKDPATVVLLLSSPEEDVQIKASEAIYKFAEKGTNPNTA